MAPRSRLRTCRILSSATPSPPSSERGNSVPPLLILLPFTHLWLSLSLTGIFTFRPTLLNSLSLSLSPSGMFTFHSTLLNSLSLSLSLLYEQLKITIINQYEKFLQLLMVTETSTKLEDPHLYRFCLTEDASVSTMVLGSSSKEI